MLAIGALLGCAATLLALAIRRALTLTAHRRWWATASNWPTSQHDALLCRGYVQDGRRERLRDIRHGRPVEEPNLWGERYLLDGEIARRTEADAMSTRAMTAVGDFAQALAELADGYPTDPEGAVPVIVTVTAPATGKPHQVLVEPGQLDWLTALVRGELDTCPRRSLRRHRRLRALPGHRPCGWKRRCRPARRRQVPPVTAVTPRSRHRPGRPVAH